MGMAKLFVLVLVAAFAFALYASTTEKPPVQCPACIADSEISVYFCPEDECDAQIVGQINAAQQSIHAAVYSFTLDSVGDALIEAKARGVEVRVVLDEGQAAQEASEFQRLRDANIAVLLDGNPDYMHNKFAVFDSSKVATGSYNWTKHATKGNDENLILLKSAELAAKYEAEFSELWEEALAAGQQ